MLTVEVTSMLSQCAFQDLNIARKNMSNLRFAKTPITIAHNREDEPILAIGNTRGCLTPSIWGNRVKTWKRLCQGLWANLTRRDISPQCRPAGAPAPQ
jgi:hypothetical protein